MMVVTDDDGPDFVDELEAELAARRPVPVQQDELQITPNDSKDLELGPVQQDEPETAVDKTFTSFADAVEDSFPGRSGKSAGWEQKPSKVIAAPVEDTPEREAMARAIATANGGGRVRQAASLARCDHNCIPCRKLFRSGWVCVRCGDWFRSLPARAER